MTMSWAARFQTVIRELHLREKSRRLELQVAPLHGGPYDGSWRYFRADLPRTIYFVNAGGRGCYRLDRAARRYIYQGTRALPR
jgi:hypothetical protein